MLHMLYSMPLILVSPKYESEFILLVAKDDMVMLILNLNLCLMSELILYLNMVYL